MEILSNVNKYFIDNEKKYFLKKKDWIKEVALKEYEAITRLGLFRPNHFFYDLPRRVRPL
jgi:hypothetical protein